MTLSTPTPRYDPTAEGRRNREIEQADKQNLKQRRDVEITAGVRLILQSPDGTRWGITVDNAGALGTVAL